MFRFFTLTLTTGHFVQIQNVARFTLTLTTGYLVEVQNVARFTLTEARLALGTRVQTASGTFVRSTLCSHYALP